MKKVAILTDFIAHDPAYSLCGVVANQVKMLVGSGYTASVLVRSGFVRDGAYEGAEILEYDPGEIANNVVNVTDKSQSEIEALQHQFEKLLKDVDVVLTHDLIYQPNMWKQHIAARKVAAKNEIMRWLHWVHSSTEIGTSGQVGPFSKELEGKFPNARLVAMHPEEISRKGTLYGYELDEIVEIPNPIDLTEDYHPASRAVIERADLWKADIVSIYPARLDRGKQVEVILEVFRELNRKGWDSRLVIVDFHSTAGDKATYRDELTATAWEQEPVVPLYFTSRECIQLDKAYGYHIPHKAVMDLFEYSDIFIHPSRSESDPLTVPEAAWKRCGLVLNFDLPLFRLWEGGALLYKFGSNIDIATGLPGSTVTEYGRRDIYMAHVAAGIAHLMQTNPSLSNHARVRKQRSLEAVWSRYLWPAIGGA